MFKHGADQLIIRRCLDVTEKKMDFYLNIVSFIVFFDLLLLKLYTLLIGPAVDFDGFFAVSLSGDFFPRLYKSRVSSLRPPSNKTSVVRPTVCFLRTFHYVSTVRRKRFELGQVWTSRRQYILTNS